eukprot:jgi/Tetstr1/423851/TSEL_014477.t1
MLDRFRKEGASAGSGRPALHGGEPPKRPEAASVTMRAFESSSRKLTPRGAAGQATPRSTASSAGTTGSKLCHYLEDSLNVINSVTEHIESVGAQFNVPELEAMFKSVLGELQRVVLRSSSLDDIQLDVLYTDLRALLTACERTLDDRSKEQLAGQLARIAKQAERLEGSRTQAAPRRAGAGLPPSSAAAASAETSAVSANAPSDGSNGVMQLKEEVDRLKEQNQHLVHEFKHKEARLSETLRAITAAQLQGQSMMQMRGAQAAHWPGDAQAWGDGCQATRPQGPITIHNHVGVEQQANAQAEQKQDAKQGLSFKAKLAQRLKAASAGPMGFLLAGVAGIVAREVLVRLARGGRPAAGGNPRRLQALQNQRKVITKEALRQLHACERAYHEVKQHGMKTIRNPFDQPRVECVPNYLVFEEPDSE